MNVVIEETGKYRLVTHDQGTNETVRARFEINTAVEAKTAKELITEIFPGREVYQEDRNNKRFEIP